MLIETPRLTLREWLETDVDCYLTLSRDVGYNCFSPPRRFLVKDADGGMAFGEVPCFARLREWLEPGQ